MESNPTNLEELFQKLKDYADVRIQLYKLKGINKASGFISSFITIFILIIIFSLIIICLSVGAALLIGEWLGADYYGFFIVGGIYLITGLILYSMRGKLIKTKVSDKLIKEMID